ncbi:MAG: outer membrane beta-barrel protein [Bacteroidota bacterium]
MKRFTTFIVTIFVTTFLLFAVTEAKDTGFPPAGTFGLNAEFGFDANELGLLYVLSPSIEIGVGLEFQQTSLSGDGLTDAQKESKSTIGFNCYGLYFLSKGDVSPYLTLGFGYTIPPKETQGTIETTHSVLDLSFAFGGQVFITRNFAVYVEAGVNYNTASSTAKAGNTESKYSENLLRLFTSAVGASLYFH